jgi:hypothetical protein
MLHLRRGSVAWLSGRAAGLQYLIDAFGELLVSGRARALHQTHRFSDWSLHGPFVSPGHG